MTRRFLKEEESVLGSALRKNQRQAEIEDRLRGKPYLMLIETSVHDVPERVKEHDPDMFVVWNSMKKRYEIHSLANIGDTFGMHVPFECLDYRTVFAVKKSDQKIRSVKEILREMDEHNERLTAQNEKDRRNEVNAMARELRPVFKKVAWEGV